MNFKDFPGLGIFKKEIQDFPAGMETPEGTEKND